MMIRWRTLNGYAQGEVIGEKDIMAVDKETEEEYVEHVLYKVAMADGKVMWVDVNSAEVI